MYGTNEADLDSLKTANTGKLTNIDVPILYQIFWNMKKHAKACIQAQGGHFQHLL